MQKIKNEILRLFDEHNVDAMDLESLSVLLALKDGDLSRQDLTKKGVTDYYEVNLESFNDFDFKFQDGSRYPMFERFSLVYILEQIPEFKVVQAMVIKTDVKTVRTCMDMCVHLSEKGVSDEKFYSEEEDKSEIHDTVYHLVLLKTYQKMSNDGIIVVSLQRTKYSALERLKFKRRFK